MGGRRPFAVLGVVALALGLLLWRGAGDAPVLDLPSDVSECIQHLRAIHAALLEYQKREGHLPPQSGAAFLGALIASGALADTSENRAALTCPGRESGSASAYAARDMQTFPLTKYPSGGPELETIAACDNAHGMNHAGCMNVLRSDGSVVTLSLAQEIQLGRLPAGTTVIPVGKNSPLPELQKLRVD